MSSFHVYPAIDLRDGAVVRLRQGDPAQQTIYGREPAQTARRWIEAGAAWLHVVNLDGAFGETRSPNMAALAAILQETAHSNVRVQFGGGLRDLPVIEAALALGVERVVLGTAAIENPQLIPQALQKFGSDRLAVGLDTRAGFVQIRGWQTPTQRSAQEIARQMAAAGVRWFIVTDIAQDGMGSGVNLDAIGSVLTLDGARAIASGGVAAAGDIRRARSAGCAGIIIGRALYNGDIDIDEAIRIEREP